MKITLEFEKIYRISFLEIVKCFLARKRSALEMTVSVFGLSYVEFVMVNHVLISKCNVDVSS